MRALVALATPTVLASAFAAAPGPDAAPLFEGGARPLTIGAAPPGLTDDADACAGCHAAIAAEWRGSLHAASWIDPVFQASYVREPLAFCRNCHAPLNAGRTPTGVAARDGISCAACHVRDGAILGSGAHAATAPHPVRVVAALDDGAYCAPCHEFGFHTRGRETAELQQSTVTEWRARDAASCQSCHMPALDGHRAHGFQGRRDAAFVASAIDLDVRLGGDATRPTLVAKLASRAGHDVPTGDLFRRLELRVWLDGAEDGALALVYARTFGDRRAASGTPGLATERYESDDTRVGEGSATRTLDLAPLGAHAPATLRWTLDYLLMPPAIARENHVAASANVMRLREGTLRP